MSSSRQAPPKLVRTPRLNDAPLLQLASPHQAATTTSRPASRGAAGSATASRPTVSRNGVPSVVRWVQPCAGSSSACSRVVEKPRSCDQIELPPATHRSLAWSPVFCEPRTTRNGAVNRGFGSGTDTSNTALVEPSDCAQFVVIHSVRNTYSLRMWQPLRGSTMMSPPSPPNGETSSVLPWLSLRSPRSSDPPLSCRPPATAYPPRSGSTPTPTE